MSKPLTQKQAEDRAKKMEPGVEYRFDIILKPGTEFTGICHYSFTLKDTKGIFIDFKGKKITVLEVNGEQFDIKNINDIWDKNFLNLPEEMLKKGPNKLLIHFENNYYTDGNGIHTFTDVDNKQYLYIQTEPYYANRVYPVFDQPDLKGTMVFKIEAPKDWVIVSNTPEVPPSELGSHLLDQRIEDVG